MGVNLTNNLTRVTSSEGDITITGIGGSGASQSNVGIYIFNGALIESTGSGANASSINLYGIGGSTGTHTNTGIHVETNSTPFNLFHPLMEMLH